MNNCVLIFRVFIFKNNMEQAATQVIEGTASSTGPGLRIEQVTGTEEQSPGMWNHDWQEWF